MKAQLFTDILKKQNKWSLFIGLKIKGAGELAIEGGEETKDFHVTLLYGKYDQRSDEDDMQCRVQSAIAKIKDQVPEKLVFDETGRFEATESSDGLDVIYARVKAGQLEELHKALVKAMKEEGITVEENFEYHPHMTLAYIDTKKEFELKKLNYTATVGDIKYGFGAESTHDNEYKYPLEKSPEKRPSVSKSEDTQQFNIMKTDDDKRLIFGWASVAIKVDGEQVVDHQNDMVDPEDLEEAVYEYVLNFRDGGEEHISSLRKKARMVESCMFTKEKMKAMGIPEGIVPEGWWIGFYVDDDVAWEKVKNGTYQMFSIEGQGIREEVEDIEKTNRINGCGVLVVKDGKVLTGTRIDGMHKNQICGPGGHIESGEEPEEAAIREALEEFGIECRNLKSLGLLDGGRSYGKSAIFLCTEYDGEPQTDEEEMTDCKWRTIEELREERLFKPFEQSLDLLEEKSPEKRPAEEGVATEDETSPQKRPKVAKTFSEIIEKFNPYHDSLGRFATANGYASFTTTTRDPKKQHWADKAIARMKQQAASAPSTPAAAASAKPTTQTAQPTAQPAQPKPTTPPKPQKNYDKLGFADHDDADYHQLYNGRKYYQQQNLTTAQKKAADNYLESYPEPGSLYSHCQNMNYKMATGQTLTGKYKQTHDGMMSAMHNVGYNITLTRYDHDGMVNSMLQTLGAGKNYEKMSQAALKKALVGATVSENKFLSTSYNSFQTAPQSTKQIFDSRAVKINYKVKADVQGMMPGKGPGGDFGEIVLAPTNGTANRAGKITDVRLTGQMVRRKGTQTYNQPRIEIDIEI